MSTTFGHSEQPGLNCAQEGSASGSPYKRVRWLHSDEQEKMRYSETPHNRAEEGRSRGSTFRDQGTSVALALPHTPVPQ